MPGERGNRDTGFQEAVPVGERGQGATLQDQLGVSLHGLHWRQMGRKQRGQEQTLGWAVCTHADTDSGSVRTRTRQDAGTHAGAGGTGWRLWGSPPPAPISEVTACHARAQPTVRVLLGPLLCTPGLEAWALARGVPCLPPRAEALAVPSARREVARPPRSAENDAPAPTPGAFGEASPAGLPAPPGAAPPPLPWRDPSPSSVEQPSPSG